VAPHARGRAFGSAQRSAVRHTVVTYRRLLRETAGIEPDALAAHGARVGERLERERPDLVAEIEGIAAGAGVGAEELLAINARTELLAGSTAQGECTLAGMLAADRVVLAQNWDWHPDLARSMVSWTLALDGGAWMTTVTEAGMLGKLGLNAHGVAVGLNFLESTEDGGTDGVPVHALLRMVLDSARSASDALTLLLGARVSASACVSIAVAEAGGHALAAVELAPSGPSVVWPDDRGLLVHANHFIAGPPEGADALVREQPSTLLRQRHAMAMLAGGAGVERALAAHFPSPHGICRHDDDAAVPWAERRATILSLVADPGARALTLAAGPPCERPFRSVEVEP
jgi:isopenicillin-N N-acyltransferase like protein